MNEKEMGKENATKKVEEKIDGKRGILSKLPLKEGIMAVGITAGVMGINTVVSGCSEESRKIIKDGTDSEVAEVEDNVEADVEKEDIVEDEVLEIVEDEVSSVEEEDAVADQDAVEEETPAEIVEDEVQDVAEVEGDAVENDVVTDVGTEEEVQVSCDAHDATRLVILRAGDQIMIGGVTIRYDGLDASNNAVFSLLCNDVEVKTNIVVPVGTTYTEDVNEQRFRVTFNPRSASSLLTNVTITVDAY